MQPMRQNIGVLSRLQHRLFGSEIPSAVSKPLGTSFANRRAVHSASGYYDTVIPTRLDYDASIPDQSDGKKGAVIMLHGFLCVSALAVVWAVRALTRATRAAGAQKRTFTLFQRL